MGDVSLPELSGLNPIDAVAACILLAALLRGIWRGLIAEAFSIAALAAACVAVRIAAAPFGTWLNDATGGEIGATAAPWIAGALLAAAAVAVVAIAGNLVKRGAQAAGLAWADRVGGAAVGLAEGALVVALGLITASWLLGARHPVLTSSRSVQVFAQLRSTLGADAAELPAVAAPPQR